jgi:hypothetical protein
MTNYEKLKMYLNSDDSPREFMAFIDLLANLLNISDNTALSIWYAEQRSWFKPGMVDELIRLDDPNAVGFRPNLGSGEFTWNDNKKCFEPEN